MQRLVGKRSNDVSALGEDLLARVFVKRGNRLVVVFEHVSCIAFAGRGAQLLKKSLCPRRHGSAVRAQGALFEGVKLLRVTLRV